MPFPRALTCATLVLASACSSPAPDVRSAEPVERAPLPAVTAPTLQEAIVRARQELSGPAYALTIDGARLTGENAALDAVLELDRSGARVSPRDGGPALVLATSALGCAGAERELAPATRVEHPRANRVELVRAGVREWIVNGQAGVEQGFDVSEVPSGCAALRVVNAPSEGLVADVDRDGSGVVLRDARQQPRLRVGHAFARDARGVSLPVRFEPAGTSWALRVEIAGAELPIAIDPLVFRYEGTLDEQVRLSYFGLQVDLYEDTAVVGAYYDDGIVGIRGAGAAYVFRRTGTTWTLEAELGVSGAHENDWFGWEVSIWRDTIAVGAVNDENERGTNGGAVYVWTRAGSTWTQQARLLAPTGSRFGCGVSIHEDTIAAGHYGGPDLAGPGMVSVFLREGTTWTEQQRISRGGAAFGREVVVHGDVLVVASMLENGLRNAEGRVHVYRRSSGMWSPALTLQASDPSADDWFGYGLAFDGHTIAVGATGSWLLRSSPHLDRVFLFEPSGVSWAQVARFEMPESDYEFEVAVNGPHAAAGPELFQRDTPAWAHVGSFGRVGTTEGVALWGDTLALGRNTAVDVYRLGDPLLAGAACRVDVECASGFCVEGVCCESACNEDVWVGVRCSSCLAARTGLADGVCAPLRAGIAETVVCRGQLDSCDAEETCSPALEVCPADALAPAGTICREAYGACDRAEHCDGTSAACPTDRTASGTVCRPATGPCDVEERCSFGVLCPADVRQPSSFVCRPVAGDCDLPETCGASADGSCPPDGFATDQLCRDAAGDCDVAEWCTGASPDCPADARRDASTVCRASIDPCDLEERCDGSSSLCPDDWRAPELSACSDGLACNGPEICRSGRCSSTTAIACDDGDACTADACTEPDGACEHTPIEGCCTSDAVCDDGDACTTDRCASGRCAHEPVASCEPGSDAGGPADGGATDDDAGGARDGGTAGEPDAAVEPEAPASGCGCSVPGRPSHRAGGLSLWLAGLLLALLTARPRPRGP